MYYEWRTEYRETVEPAPGSSQTTISGRYANIETLLLCCSANDIQLYTGKTLPRYFTWERDSSEWLVNLILLYWNIKNSVLCSLLTAPNCNVMVALCTGYGLYYIIFYSLSNTLIALITLMFLHATAGINPKHPMTEATSEQRPAEWRWG